MMLRGVVHAAMVFGLLAGLVWLGGCSRGQPRERRPTVIIPDLEFQKKWKAQGYTEFFADRRMMREPPAGTVARGTLKEDIPYFTGFVNVADSVYVARNPRAMTLELLERGRARFDIYCAPCHDRTGTGRGMVVEFGLVPPPSFHEQRVRDFADGYIFNVISKGMRTMPSYGAQIPTEDRWAIVAYLRALQRSRNATLADVPADARGQLR